MLENFSEILIISTLLQVKGGVREGRHISEAGYLKPLVKSWRRNLYISGKILFEPDTCSANIDYNF